MEAEFSKIDGAIDQIDQEISSLEGQIKTLNDRKLELLDEHRELKHKIKAKNIDQDILIHFSAYSVWSDEPSNQVVLDNLEYVPDKYIAIHVPKLTVYAISDAYPGDDAMTLCIPRPDTFQVVKYTSDQLTEEFEDILKSLDKVEKIICKNSNDHDCSTVKKMLEDNKSELFDTLQAFLEDLNHDSHLDMEEFDLEECDFQLDGTTASFVSAISAIICFKP